MGDMAVHTEVWRHAMDGVEHSACFVPNEATGADNGFMSLGSASCMNVYAAQMSARMVELLREISGSGIVMQPGEDDLAASSFGMMPAIPLQ